MVCNVGDDIFGQNLLTNFKKVGVQYDQETTILKGVPSGVASIVVDSKSGDNMIIVSPGANYCLKKEDVRKAVSEASPSQVIVQLEIIPEVALEALKAGKDAGALTMLNTAPAPEGWSLEDPGMEFYPYVDVLILNESELQKVCQGVEGNEEALAKSLLPKIGRAVIVTLGSRGAMVMEKKGDDITIDYADAPADLPARKEPVKNTVGAGDSFCGALSSYLSTGLTLAEAAGYACGIASMSVRKDGAQSSYPTYDELPDSLKLDLKCRKTTTKPCVTFVTGNKKKLEEVKQILSGGDELAFELFNRKIDLPELQGDPFEIAEEKCRLAAKKVNGAVITEDTSLCFNALNGMPGPYIKWFLEKCGHDGLNRMLDGFDDRSGYAQTIVAYSAGPDCPVEVFEGRTNGMIVLPRGPLDFGWDPIFEPDEGEGKTYAEMTKEFKNSISHRGRSFEKIRRYLMDHAPAK
jgi:non-canonical purine NTP pyrophosphatase (RdgB/HAM1 family)